MDASHDVVMSWGPSELGGLQVYDRGWLEESDSHFTHTGTLNPYTADSVAIPLGMCLHPVGVCWVSTQGNREGCTC